MENVNDFQNNWSSGRENIDSWWWFCSTSSTPAPTALRAVSNIIPNIFPFATPLEWTATNSTCFCWPIQWLRHLKKHRYGTLDQAKKAFWLSTLKAEDAGARPIEWLIGREGRLGFAWTNHPTHHDRLQSKNPQLKPANTTVGIFLLF